MSKKETNLEALLWGKVLKVSETVGKLKKDGTNAHSRYKYISNENIVDAVHDACVKVGLIIIPHVDEVEHWELKSGAGKIMFKTRVDMSFFLVDSETGHKSFPVKWIGEDQDQAKSLAQAQTEAHKRFLSKLFLIPAADDKDPDSQTVTAKESNVGMIRKAFKMSSLPLQQKQELYDHYAKEHGERPELWANTVQAKFLDEITVKLEQDPDRVGKAFDALGDEK